MAALTQIGAQVVADLPSAAWDLKGFLEGAKAYAAEIGGGLLLLLGLIGVVVGGVFLLMKLFGGQQSAQKHSWGQVIMLILIGGALSTGGLSLMLTVGSGGEQTIKDLGGGAAIVQIIDGSHADTRLGSLVSLP